MKTVGIIPARYGSSRLPGKPLMEIAGKPMVWWVYERTRQARRLDGVWVATDDQRIAAVCQEYEIPFLMTSAAHPCAASRLAEAAETVEADFYVQINGDEPLISPENIDAAVPEHFPTEEAFGTNLIAPLGTPAEVMDPSNIKVVFDQSYRALYLSRTPVPYPFGALDFVYYKHVGIIGYNKKMLEFYADSVPGRFERIEGIDTMRFLDYGKTLQFIPVKKTESLSVDTAKDLDAVRRRMEMRRRTESRREKTED